MLFAIEYGRCENRISEGLFRASRCIVIGAFYSGSAPGMELLVHLAEPAVGHMGVDLRGTDAGVTEQFLNDAQVRAMFEEMGGEAVTEHVRRDVAFDVGGRDALFDSEPEGDTGELGAALGEEHRRR